jgi:hypothetical protein
MSDPIPTLFVEGPDEISLINGLLKCHGVDTEQGKKYLKIQSQGGVDQLLDYLPEAVRANTALPVGFVVDIDVKILDRWQAVCHRLRQLEMEPPAQCSSMGYLGRYRDDYLHPFGVWLMPDCQTDDSKLEHLVQSLMPADNPLWPHAKKCVDQAATIIDEANRQERRWERFRDVDRIKAEVRTWLAWQKTPGVQFGAAVNEHILRHDSPQALNFLRWLRDLYGFEQLAGL